MAQSGQLGEGGVVGHRHGLRIDGGARHGALQAVDHDLLALGQALADDAQAFQFRAQLDGAVLHGVVLVEDQDELLAQIGTDRFVLDQRGRVGAAADQLEARIETGGEAAVTVVEHRTATDGAGARVDLVVEEVQLALVRVPGFAGQAEVHRAGAARVATGLARQLDILEEHPLIDIEVGIHPVGADQGGEQALPSTDQIALGDMRAADAAINRCGDAGEPL